MRGVIYVAERTANPQVKHWRGSYVYRNLRARFEQSLFVYSQTVFQTKVLNFSTSTRAYIASAWAQSVTVWLVRKVLRLKMV